jgi:hypothetical protein
MEDRTLLSTLIVNTVSDLDLAGGLPTGQESLRQAIEDVNADTGTGVDTIDFSISGSGVQTIQPLSPWPIITHPVFIDGYSQPGASPNTLAVGDNAVLLIELNGSLAGSQGDLHIMAAGTTVRGLDVHDFAFTGIWLDGPGNDTVQGCFVGTDPTGETALADGVFVTSDGNLIGTNGDGVNDFAERNIISSTGRANGGENGNIVFGSGTSSNVAAGNYIGTDASGSKALGGPAGDNINGVWVNNGTFNRIGVNGHDPDPSAERNVISGNQGAGIVIDWGGGHNVVAGNYIGTDATGTQRLGNSGDGITINASDSNLIGTNGDGVGDSFERNIISGNNGSGMTIGRSIPGGDSINNVVAGNYIGTDYTGTQPLGNRNIGVNLANGSGTRVGTDGQSVDNIGERNIISANVTGISIGETQGGHLIAGNWIGLGSDGRFMGNGYASDYGGPSGGPGIMVFDDSSDKIGGSPALANIITNTLGTGVSLWPDDIGISIWCNSIYDANGNQPAIYLYNGGNLLQQSSPVLTAVTGGVSTRVVGTLNSTPDATFTLDFYSSDRPPDSSGRGQGQFYLGSIQVRTDDSGYASLTATGLGSTTVGQWVSATATDPGGSTSQFSVVLQVVQASTTTALTASADSPLLGQPVTFTAAVTAGPGTPTGSVDFVDTTTNTDLGTVPLTGGVAVLTTSALAIGSHAIVANYGGDTTDLTSSASTTINVLPPASLSGLVFDDLNNNGQVDFGEQGIPGVPITLTGTDDLGHAVNLSQTTDADGTYVFLNLRPGMYTIIEAQQPAGYTPGIDTVGTAGGTLSGTQFTVSLPAGVDGLNYNYGEIPNSTGPVQSGQTATIGFWNNKNGQALIQALNGGVGTHLGDWLATSFPHMFGSDSGSNDLAGQSNAYIAAFFQQKFVVHGQKLDAQVLATALAVYVTDPTLDTTDVGAQYGFIVGGNGLATATYNVGSNGASFGVADNTVMTVMDILLAADAQAVNGVLYNGDTVKRNMANNVFSGINQAGDI